MEQRHNEREEGCSGLSDLLVTGLGHWKQCGLEPQMLIDYLLCASYYPWHDTVLLGGLPSCWGCFVKMEKHRMLAHPEINTALMNRQSFPPSKSQIKVVNIPKGMHSLTHQAQVPLSTSGR